MLIVFRDLLPIVVEFNQDATQKTFSQETISHLLAFLSDRAGYHANGAAMIVDITKDHKRILEFSDTPEAELPTFRVIRLEEDMTKALYLKLLIGLLPPHPGAHQVCEAR